MLLEKVGYMQKNKYFKSLECRGLQNFDEIYRIEGKLYKIIEEKDGSVWYNSEDNGKMSTKIDSSIQLLSKVKDTRLARKMYPDYIKEGDYLYV